MLDMFPRGEILIMEETRVINFCRTPKGVVSKKGGGDSWEPQNVPGNKWERVRPWLK